MTKKKKRKEKRKRYHQEKGGHDNRRIADEGRLELPNAIPPYHFGLLNLPPYSYFTGTSGLLALFSLPIKRMFSQVFFLIY
jgi:hypothetical protein